MKYGSDIYFKFPEIDSHKLYWFESFMTALTEQRVLNIAALLYIQFQQMFNRWFNVAKQFWKYQNTYARWKLPNINEVFVAAVGGDPGEVGKNCYELTFDSNFSAVFPERHVIFPALLSRNFGVQCCSFVSDVLRVTGNVSLGYQLNRLNI